MHIRSFVITAGLLLAATHAHSIPIQIDLIDPSISSGTVSGTSIGYTVTKTGDIAAGVAPPGFGGTTDTGVWQWTDYADMLSHGGTQTLDVDFTAPIGVNRVVLFANSIVSPANIALSLTGGTANLSDFISDGLATVPWMGLSSAATYDGSTGVLTPGGVGQSGAMIGGNSLNTITGFSFNATNNEGFRIGFGFTQLDSNSGGSAPVPEPSTVLLLGTGLVGLVGYGHRRRKAA